MPVYNNVPDEDVIRATLSLSTAIVVEAVVLFVEFLNLILAVRV
jgi:hypothetical protein